MHRNSPNSDIHAIISVCSITVLQTVIDTEPEKLHDGMVVIVDEAQLLTYQAINDSRECMVTLEAIKKANKGAVLNPCPPFYRGEEVSADVIDSDYFVGYKFKQHLLNVQQAIMVYCLTR